MVGSGNGFETTIMAEGGRKSLISAMGKRPPFKLELQVLSPEKFFYRAPWFALPCNTRGFNTSLLTLLTCKPNNRAKTFG